MRARNSYPTNPVEATSYAPRSYVLGVTRNVSAADYASLFAKPAGSQAKRRPSPLRDALSLFTRVTDTAR